MQVGDLVVYCRYGKRSACDLFEGYDNYGNLVMIQVKKENLRQGLGIIIDTFCSYPGSPRPLARIKWIDVPEILQQSYNKGRIPTVDFIAHELLVTL